MGDRRNIYMNRLKNRSEEEREVLETVVEQLVQLERQLEDLKKVPHLLYKKNNPAIQQVTPAGRLYRERLTSYQNLLQIFLKLTAVDSDEDAATNQLLKALEEFR